MHPEPAPSTLSFLLQGIKKGLPAVPIYHSSRGDWAGEANGGEGEVLQMMGILWHSKD